EDPWLDQRAAANHHRCDAALLPAIAHFVPGQQIAVADHRDRAFRSNLFDRFPVRSTGVALVLGATVNEHRLGAGFFADARNLTGVLLVFGPAQTDLDRNWHGDAVDHASN